MEFGAKAAVGYNRCVMNWHGHPVSRIMSFLRARNPGVPADAKFERMLDAGCGGGKSTTVYAPYFRSVIGIDSSKEMIETAKKIGSAKNVTYVVGAGEAMPVGDQSIDLVASAFAAMHMDFPKFVCECKRVLKSTGCAALSGGEFVDIRSASSEGPSGVKLWRSNVIHPIRNYFFERNDLMGSLYDRYKTMFSMISGMNKERDDSLSFCQAWSLKNVKDMFRAIPFPQSLWDSFKADPLDSFGEELKTLWGISGQKDEDVALLITVSIFILFLTPKH